MAKKKKLKKKTKVFLILFLIIVVLVVGLFVFKKTTKKESVKEAKVVSKIDGYGYSLKDNKSAAYKELFKKLKTELSKDEVNEKNYAKIITKMFIIDFYSLAERKAKTDIGGVDFVNEDVLDNFILNAEDTYYKYVESNIYGQRKQELPEVDEVTIESVENEEYSYLETIDENAFVVSAKWTYKEGSGSGYQDEATLTFIHNGKKLELVELK